MTGGVSCTHLCGRGQQPCGLQLVGWGGRVCVCVCHWCWTKRLVRMGGLHGNQVGSAHAPGMGEMWCCLIDQECRI